MKEGYALDWSTTKRERAATRSMITAALPAKDRSKRMSQCSNSPHRMAEQLGAEVVEPEAVDPESLRGYDLVGFGSGIYFMAVDARLRKLVGGLPRAEGGRAFTFFTSGGPRLALLDYGRQIRNDLESKGFQVLDSFSCRGWDTAGPLRLIGGVNKGRPDERDLEHAAAFAARLRQQLRSEACILKHIVEQNISRRGVKGTMFERVTTVVSQVAEAAAATVGVRTGTEEPQHTVEASLGGVEIRCYGPRIAAETTVDASEERARNEGFRRLARYIFGANHGRAKIAMTAPVAQQQASAGGTKIAMTAPVSQEQSSEGAWVIRFFMPAEWTLDSLPTPDDGSVKLAAVPEQRFAVLRFTGARDPGAVATKTTELLETLKDTEYQVAGDPAAWFYDPPWTLPFLRRNEVVVPVTKR